MKLRLEARSEVTSCKGLYSIEAGTLPTKTPQPHESQDHYGGLTVHGETYRLSLICRNGYCVWLKQAGRKGIPPDSREARLPSNGDSDCDNDL